ncbi:hypothetical protein F5X96DRAFT_638486, partial [Biscogniauxia mediterranea]
MDHLPKIHGAENAPWMRVPCLVHQSGLQYPSQPQGPEGFKTFPSLHGYDHETLVAGVPSNRDTVAFLQSWLFFGLLTEVFARPNYDFHREDFVRTSSSTGEVLISTKALPRYFYYWLAVRSHEDPDAVQMQEKMIDECLVEANRVLNSINARLRGQLQTQETHVRQTAETAVFLSLSLLGDYLTFAQRSLEKESTAPPLAWESVYLDEIMKDAGWCVGELSTMRRSCNLSARYYLSMIDRNALANDHSRCMNNTRCQAHHVRFHSYQTKHIPDCHDDTGCTEIGPNVEEVITAIENGGSALIRAYGHPTDGPFRLQVLQTGGESCPEIKPYVAISHVWSDGRGNPRRNCLCRCQMFYIQSLVNNLYDSDLHPVPFWMDTLCIPVGQANYQTRRKAIIRIAHTFTNADKVLVVDSSLLSCPAGGSWLENFMRIQYSPWMTRLWTYLEGRIARNIYFQLGNERIQGTDLESVVHEPGDVVQLSKDLQELPEDRLRSSRSAMQLIRAMATAMPSQHILEMSPQSDTDMEEIRQDALRLLETRKEYYELPKIWRPFLEKEGVLELDYGDDVLKTELERRIICPVTDYGRTAVASFRAQQTGLRLADMRTTPDTPGRTSDLYAAVMFRELSVGFAGRTTSWLDDETVCVGTLLGADMARIQDIKPMDWRWRRQLDKVDCRTTRSPFFKIMGISFARWTEACHVQRMKLLLSQIQSFPLHMIYWNEPRLETKQWTWAPRSFLNRDFADKFHWVHGTTTLGPRGLEFATRAYRLGIQSRQEDKFVRATRGLANLVRRMKRWWQSRRVKQSNSWQGNTVLIHPTTYIPPESQKYAWLRVQFHPQDKTVAPAEARNTWQDYIDSGEINNLAILFDDRFGALVRVCESCEQEGTLLVRHVRLLSNPVDIPVGEQLPVVSGTYYPSRQKWLM